MLLYGVFVSLLTLTVRLGLDDIWWAQLLCMASWGTVILLFPWVVCKGWRGLIAHSWKLLFYRGVSLTIMLAAYMFSIPYLGIGEAVMLKHTAPLFVPVTSRLLLFERMNRWVVAGCIIGFVGIAVLLHPIHHRFNIGWLVGLLGGLCAAFNLVWTSSLSSKEPPQRILFYSTLAMALILTPFTAMHWTTLTESQWLYLAFNTALLTLAGVAIVLALRFGPASRIAPLSYFSICFSFLWGWMAFNESISIYVLIGTVFVTVGSIMSIWHRA